jgi:hypothetical protein
MVSKVLDLRIMISPLVWYRETSPKPKLRSPTLPEEVDRNAQQAREAEPAGRVVIVISPEVGAAGEWDGGV